MTFCYVCAQLSGERRGIGTRSAPFPPACPRAEQLGEPALPEFCTQQRQMSGRLTGSLAQQGIFDGAQPRRVEARRRRRTGDERAHEVFLPLR